MNHSILLKGNKYGIVVVLDATVEFSRLLKMVEEKFKESAKFFDTKCKVAITFEGRTLSNDDIKRLLDVISRSCEIQISYVIDSNKEVEEYFQKSILKQEEKVKELTKQLLESQKKETYNQQQESSNNAMFYKGTLRSGQSLKSTTSLIILGDVNLGAEVQAAGNVIVLGCLKGTAFAGCQGNANTFVMALEMEPMQIRIAKYIARASDREQNKEKNKKTKEPRETKIAFVENENIYIESVSKNLLNDINI